MVLGDILNVTRPVNYSVSEEIVHARNAVRRLNYGLILTFQ